MRCALLLGGLASLALTSAQGIDFEAVHKAPAPVKVGPAPEALNETVTYDADKAAASVSASVTFELQGSFDDDDDDDSSDKDDKKIRRRNHRRPKIEKRDVNKPCSRQPVAFGPSPDDSDTIEAWKALPDFAELSHRAYIPKGYQLAFENLNGAMQANTYMGLQTLTSYDPSVCQSLCDAQPLCKSFNIFFERDPFLAPAPACPNPISVTTIRCTLWGSPVTKEACTNTGALREQFQVLIAGSNGYTKLTPPAAISGFVGPVALPGAINAPYTNPNSYMGMRYMPGLYDAGKCMAVCTATTIWNKAHPKPDGSYEACNFFNAYLLSIDGVPDGLYCSMYRRQWGESEATNHGQNRGQAYYSVSSSYGYTLSPLDPERLVATT